MIPNAKTPGPIAAHLSDLGSRIAKIRLSQNVTQIALAEASGTSLGSIKRLEAGKNASLDTFIRVLFALGLGDHLSHFLPNPDIRPIERVRLQGRERLRARTSTKDAVAKPWTWATGNEE